MDVETVAVIDFETTGTAPGHGARATELALVWVRQGRIVDHWASLMHSGVPVPPFIQQLTGITDAMLRDAPPAAEVMREAMRRAAGCPLVAHNAAFDRAFWRAEAAAAAPGGDADPAHAEFACTVRLSRRIHPEAPNHRLSTLAAWHGLPPQGRAHRALADALTTAALLARLQQDAAARFADALAGRAVTHAVLRELQRAPCARVAPHLSARYRAAAATDQSTTAQP